MAIEAGDRIPDVKLMTMTPDGPQAVQSGEVLGKGRVVLFAVPGAFTPTCSEKHLPGFLVRAEDIKAKGVDTIACVAVNDAFVMGAWGAQQDPDGNVLFLADGNGEFTAEMGLEMDGSGFGLGTRSQRYAAIIDDGVITELLVEPAPGLEVSSAESVLAKL
ncbi:MAG TPA: peroxiredoxin [Acidimicrobiales bacterium]